MVHILTDFSSINKYPIIVNFQREACSFSPKGFCSHFLASWILPPHSLASPVSLSSPVASWTIKVFRTFTQASGVGVGEDYNFPSILPLYLSSFPSLFPPTLFLNCGRTLNRRSAILIHVSLFVFSFKLL